MRVLHLYAGNLYGGIERMLVTLASERHHCPEMEPHFGLCFEGRAAKELRATGVPVHMMGEVHFSRPWTVWRARRRLRELLRLQSYDAVVCHACWPHAVFGAVARKHCRLAFWLHDYQTGSHWLERVASRTSPAVVIANSHFTSGSAASLFPGAPVKVVHCVVPPSPQTDASDVRRRIRVELETPADAVVIVMAARLERWKGHTLLLETLAGLVSQPGWHCWIAGGPQRPSEHQYLRELRQQADSTGLVDRVQFLGQRGDVAQLLAAADIHCQPNTGPEPFGIAFIEAMHAALPLVTTNMGGGAEIVTPACGVLVPPADARALAEALQGLIGDEPRRRLLGAGGRSRALELCDARTQLSAIASILEDKLHRGVAA